jgi:Zn-dependent peptidase ImmA (M78 family)
MPTRLRADSSEVAGSAQLSLRLTDGDIVHVPAWRLSPSSMLDTKPFRRFRWYKGQQHYSGAYWSSTESAHPHDGLDPRVLAKHLRVAVVDADRLVSRTDLEELERLQDFSFSAATFHIGERDFVVVNPLRALARQNSDMSHELSHIILGHKLSEVRELNGQPFRRTCKPDEEEEATTFGGTLLLPRPLLVSAGRRGATIEQIASEYGVTVDMARYRYNSTGIDRQLKQARR